MALTLHRSNRTERLADALAAVLNNPANDPFTPDIIVVQSLGMRRWLSLELASRHGICSNCQFPFPKKFVDDVFAAVLPDKLPDERFDRAAMTWHIFNVLPPLLNDRAFAAVKNYVEGHSSLLKLFQLSEKVAGLFDQYLVFRPEMILDWQAGADDDWQAILWRKLTEGCAETHPVARSRAVSRRLKQLDFPRNSLPSRVCLFGISSLPPFYTGLFGEFAKALDVHLFLLDPTPEYWGDIISATEEDSIRRKLKRPTLTTEQLHAEQRNSLLASLGKTGRDFHDAVVDLDPTDGPPLFILPSGTNMLPSVQADIFQLRDPETKRPVAGTDRSIQIHNCHSPMREMEVLHDQLLAMFESDPALLPKDIVVMTPDVKSYAPFVEAVFGSPESREREIPFSIADRGIRSENSIADVFLQIVALSRTRFGAGSVLAVLESPDVRRRFQLAECDVERIRAWVESAGIRWGIDGAHRRKLGLPGTEQNTWRAGLNRLLLGYALPAGDENLFHGILPCDDVEGSDAEALGRFIDFAEKLFGVCEKGASSRPLSQWSDFLSGLLDDFFLPDEQTEWQLQQVRQLLHGLKTVAVLPECGGDVPFDVVLAHLRQLLDIEETTGGFITGRVTFCALRPMRSVPFKVVCLVGMNDGSYPRPQKLVSFDKMAEKPRRGDRSIRDDDRYLFLEAILSARDTFYLSYVGQSIRDNSSIPPSVLVSELLDYLERGFELPDGESVANRVVTKHRLQAFSTAYFQGGELWSYSAENCAASRTGAQERKAPAVFVPAPLPPSTDLDSKTVNLDALAKFFCNASEFFLKNRLGVRMWEPDPAITECETLEMDALTRHQAREFLASRTINRADAALSLSVLRAQGQLPPGSLGEIHSRHLAEAARLFAETIAKLTREPPLPDLPFETSFGGWRVTGSIRNVYPSHLLRYRCADVKPKDLIRTWIDHVAANVEEPRCATVYAGLDRVLRFEPVANAGQIVGQWVDWYARGLCEPLKFFPQTSYAFASRKLKPRTGQSLSALQAAENEWYGNDYTVGESTNRWIERCFRHVEDPLDAEWQALAETFFAPLLASIREECP